MSQPCEEKETIEKIRDKLDSRDAVLTTLQVKQAEIAGQICLVGADISHVKGRIDNGMSHTIARIDANLIELKPIIEHHADIVKRIEDMGWLISRLTISSFVAALVGVIVWAIARGWKP